MVLKKIVGHPETLQPEILIFAIQDRTLSKLAQDTTHWAPITLIIRR
jgi:hypothetical protein